MPKNAKRGAGANQPLTSLEKSVGLIRSEIKISSQHMQAGLTQVRDEMQAGLAQIRDEMRTGFDQLYRHVDGFVKLHETLVSGIERADESPGGSR
ncbi:MAG: hypothetical protein HY695_37515 [Deltaproteobacteria bacterium]|nr:hypothetical protein [Deltaproteobacteria bacterium]